MVQRLLSRQPMLRVQHEQLPDQVDAVWRDSLKLFMIEVIVKRDDLLENDCLAVPLERQISTHKRVQDDSEGPEVGLLAVGALNYFRGHVVGRTCHLFQVLPRVRGNCETEVNQTHRVICCDHDIIRLDITMYNILRMAMIDRLQE